MTRAEAHRRGAVAMKRYTEADLTAALLYAAATLFGAAFRAIVHLCIGFGIAAVAGQSAWWGLPAALLSSTTLGRLWEYGRRTSIVLALEAAADAAVAAKAVKP